VYLVCNYSLYKLDPAGNILQSFGSKGTGNGQFGPGIPMDIAVDAEGAIFVADIGNYRIQKFDANGHFIAAFGSEGTAPSQLSDAFEITLGSDGLLYVTDSGNHRIQKFTADGSFVSAFGKRGNQVGEFDYPHDTFIDEAGALFVCDYRNGRISSYAANGTFLGNYPIKEQEVKGFGSTMLRTNQYPQRITRDSSRMFYVINYALWPEEGCLLKYDASFNFLKQIDLSLFGFRYLDFPSDIATLPGDRFLLSQERPLRLDIINTNGEYFGQFGSYEMLSLIKGLKETRVSNIVKQLGGKFFLLEGVLLCFVVWRMCRAGLKKSA
jgi:hypothetical protein